MAKLSNGTRVRTAAVLDPRDYTTEAQQRRVPNREGIVCGSSDRHGLCYLVHHVNTPEAWYDADELEEMHPKGRLVGADEIDDRFGKAEALARLR